MKKLVFSGIMLVFLVVSVATVPNYSFVVSGNLWLAPSNFTSAATTRTMNTFSGKVLLSAGSATYTVTCANCTANSLIWAQINAVDTTAIYVRAVPGSGSFTLVVPANATANLPISWWLMNP